MSKKKKDSIIPLSEWLTPDAEKFVHERWAERAEERADMIKAHKQNWPQQMHFPKVDPILERSYLDYLKDDNDIDEFRKQYLAEPIEWHLNPEQRAELNKISDEVALLIDEGMKRQTEAFNNTIKEVLSKALAHEPVEEDYSRLKIIHAKSDPNFMWLYYNEHELGTITITNETSFDPDRIYASAKTTFTFIPTKHD